MKYVQVFLGAVFLWISQYSVGFSDQAVVDSLRVAIKTDIRSFNPGVKRDGTTDGVVHHIYEGLVAYKADLGIAPMLAEKIDVSEDGTRYHFTLRRGVKFHNGDELTADIVKWNWLRILKPDTRWRCRSWFDGSATYSTHIKNIEVHDRYNVTFILAKPSVTFLHRMANVQCFSAIIHPGSVDLDGEIRRPVGTGPYKLKEWRRGEYVEIERFEDYSQSDMPMDGLSGRKEAVTKYIRFLIIPDVSVAKSALLAGDIDVVKAPITIYPEFENIKTVNRQVHPILNWIVLLVQTEDKILQDVKIRRAISHAIDRDRLVEYATLGFGAPNSSAIPDKSPYYGKRQNTWYDFDPQKAKTLLVEAGYQGQAVTIQTNRKYAHLYDNAIIIHSMLRDVGINAKLEVLDWASQLNNFYSGNFQLSSFDFSARTEPYLNYLIITGPKSRNAANQWDSEEALDLLARSEMVADTPRRQAIFDTLHDVMREDIPIIGLYNLRELLLTSADLVGYESLVIGLSRFWGVYRPSDSASGRGVN